MRSVLFVAIAVIGSMGCRSPAPSTRPGTAPAPRSGSALEPPPAPAEAHPTGPVMAPPGVVGSVALNGVATGALESGDTAGENGAVHDDHTVMLNAGEPVTIVTRGGPSSNEPGRMLDVFTSLNFEARSVASDDNSARDGNAPNSRIVHTPAVSGQYTIRVTTAGSGLHQGQYNLQVYPGRLDSQL